MDSKKTGCRMRRVAASVWALVSLGAAQAQVMDEIEWRDEGANAVLTVRLNVPVQYLRAVPARSRDLVQAFYAITRGENAPRFIEGDRRALTRQGPLPQVSVTDEADPNRSQRRLIVRFDTPQRFSVRPGRTPRSIDLVLPGLGPSVRAVRPGSSGTPSRPADMAYLLELDRAAAPLVVPALPPGLEGVQASVQSRVVDGRVEYQLLLGRFSDRAQADRARLLLPTYPNARVLEAPAATAQTVAAPPTDADTGPAASAGTPADPEARAQTLLARARNDLTKPDPASALAALEELLALPPSSAAREAQALIGEVRAQLGDNARARAEFETFLTLYPEGEDAQRARARLAELPAPPAPALAATPPAAPDPVSVSGSFAQTYYGGQFRALTLFKDTPLEGQVPQVVSQNQLSATDQNQLVSSADLSWRYRDAGRDMRFVFRDSFTADFLAGEPNENRLSALYFDYKDLALGLQGRIGRQSGQGGGVLGRFDGLQGSWSFRPKWKLGAVLGQPTDDLAQSKRHFYGLSVDADSLLPNVGGSAYLIQQTIDGEVDRRALGLEARWFHPSASVFSVLEYDIALKGLNVASFNGTFTTEGNSTFNLLMDRRSTPLLMLGNALFFSNPNLATPPTRLSDLLGLQTVAQLRQQVQATTAYTTQATAGFTTPVSTHWQAGADLRLTSVGAIAPVPDILPTGQAATGNIWTAGAQAIGTNLYSARDTHVVNLSYVRGPDFQGWLASYNNLSVPWPNWQVEPSLRLFQQTSSNGGTTTRWTPGLRVTWRVAPKWSIESDLTVERSKTVGIVDSSTGLRPHESANRVNYYIGYRYDH